MNDHERPDEQAAPAGGSDETTTGVTSASDSRPAPETSPEPTPQPPTEAPHEPSPEPSSGPPSAAPHEPSPASESGPPSEAANEPSPAPESGPPSEAAAGAAAGATSAGTASAPPATGRPAGDGTPRHGGEGTPSEPRRSRSRRGGRKRSGRKLRVPQLDLRDQHYALRRELAHAIGEVINSGGFILGPKVAAFEEAVAHYSSARHGIGVGSGTDALILALRVLGIGPGDEVITSAYSFISSGSSIALVGARPVFVDIDPESWNLDPAQVEAKVSERTRAILPVHLFGQCVPMEPLLDIASRRGLAIIEDAAQALGAEDGGKRAGSLGTLGCFSFYPTKNLGGMGDGGMIVTSDDELAETLRILRVHGAKPKYVNKVLGLNSRLDALQAAILIVKLQHLEQYTEARRQHARAYSERMKELGIPHSVERHGSRHIYNQYAIRLENRDEVARKLKERGVDTQVYYPVPMHRQEVFGDLGYQEGDFPHAEEAARTTLCLPIYPELSKRARDHVIQQLTEVLRKPERKPETQAEDQPARAAAAGHEGEPVSTAAHSPETHSEGTPADRPEAVPERVPDDTSHGALEQAPDDTSHGTAEPAPDDTSHGTPEQAPDDTSHGTAEQAPDDTPHGTAEQAPDDTPHGTPEQAPDDTPHGAPESTPETRPEDTPERRSESVPETVPEPKPETRPERE